ncbi:MAG: hypothetical protein P1U58_03655 [Verrucomicrobiales bacterium]|nr:hypothetical protein [Verrucomicrobiales bacterium]
MTVRLFFAWLLVSLGIAGFLFVVVSLFVPGMGNLKGTGSIVFAAFFLLAAGYLTGDF